MSKWQLLLLLLPVCTASLTPGRPLRSKRGLLELNGIIKCSTGRSSMAYIMYGCYCGLGGQGWPRDKADW
ncbi:group 10 secretory phospholipase A2-like [Arapaima gigas]